MKLKALLIGLLGLGSACVPAWLAGFQVSINAVISTTTQATQTKQQSALATPLLPLPGKGLGQHSFLYCGQWEPRKPVQTMYIIRDGKVA